eukprot:4982158-Alexandrium_andersonii.AAC.1
MMNASSVDTCLYLQADSSPQFGRDWFILEYSMIQGSAPAYKRMSELIDRLATLDALANAFRRDGRLSECAEMQKRECADAVRAAIDTHIPVPTSLGSKRSSLAHKLHCLIHNLILDFGDLESVCRWCSRVVRFTSDQGTESLFWSVPESTLGLQ